MDGRSSHAHVLEMDRDLPLDLRFAIAAISARFNACRMVSLRDVDEELPVRELSNGEVERLLSALADHGIRIIGDDAADHLGKPEA